MRKLVLAAILFVASVGLLCPPSASAYDFGDFKSATLATKAWGALAQKDLEAVLAYTNKCLELYGEKAKAMQAELKDYVVYNTDDPASKDKVFSYWALNDAATCLFIQGEAYREAGMKEEAKKAYTQVIESYSFGQTWDTKGWFWKPAEAAKEKLKIMDSGLDDFGDNTSATLVGKAWKALADNSLDKVLAYTNKCLELYGEKAKAMQAELKDYVVYNTDDPASKDKVFSYWALNDVATGLYIQGEVYLKAGMKDEAKKAFMKIIESYSFGQTWDTAGWFWKPAEAAKDKLKILDSGMSVDYGNYSSSFLVTQAWKALGANSLDGVLIYTDKLLEMYEKQAFDMQKSLKEYPFESNEKIFSYWALNDVGTGLYIRGEAYKKAGKTTEAKEAYQRLIHEFSFAQCWDPAGWFWKPAEAAQQAVAQLN